MSDPTTSWRTEDGAAPAVDPGTGGEPTVAERVRGAIGDEPLEVAVHRANDGSLASPRERTERYASLADLPDEPLGGWEELLVYTETHVYRWIAGGYDVGPTRLPRDPEPAE